MFLDLKLARHSQHGRRRSGGLPRPRPALDNAALRRRRGDDARCGRRARSPRGRKLLEHHRADQPRRRWRSRRDQPKAAPPRHKCGTPLARQSEPTSTVPCARRKKSRCCARRAARIFCSSCRAFAPPAPRLAIRNACRTPRSRVEAGADYLVIGRPVTEAADPQARGPRHRRRIAMSVAVKICGLTSEEAVQAAVAGGARFTGFVFIRRARAASSVAQAARLVAGVPPRSPRRRLRRSRRRAAR